MAIKLPEDPDGSEYEDLVAAHLRSAGYFTETRLILREDGKEVLELDVVATPTAGTRTESELFEVKKRRVGFESIFKVFGQRTYLGIDRACLVTAKGVPPEHRDTYSAKGSEMGVRVCSQPATIEIASDLVHVANQLASPERRAVAAAAWYQQIGRRLAQAEFERYCRTRKREPYFSALRGYFGEVQNAFFARSGIARCEALYRAFTDAPKMAGDGVRMIADKKSIGERAVWNQLNDTGEHLWLQHQMILETQAKVAVIKNALDDLEERGDRPLPKGRLVLAGTTVEWPVHFLPDRFVAGLEALRGHAHASQLPYLYQVFTELLGGFLRMNDAEELAFVERLTRVPADQVVPSLRLLDHFFAPIGGTCFYEQKQALLCMKLIPGVVRGGGAFLRHLVFQSDDYGALCPKMGWLLAKWHRALYNLLEPALAESHAGT